MPIHIGSFALPSIETKKEAWQIGTRETAGGYVYPLPRTQLRPLARDAFAWTWKVDRFPSVKTADPSAKEADDYAVRVGILIRGNGEASMPGDLEKVASKLQDKVSYVLFYSACDRKELLRRCFKNPFSDRVINCLIPAGGKPTPVRVFPLDDLKSVISISSEVEARLSAIGIWIFADSDNSKSESQATLAQLRIEDRREGK